MQDYAALCGKSAADRYLFSGGGNAEALYHLFQCADVHRLGQVFVHAGFLALLHILKEGVGGHGKDGDGASQRVFAAADAAGGFQGPTYRRRLICTSIRIMSYSPGLTLAKASTIS